MKFYLLVAIVLLAGCAQQAPDPLAKFAPPNVLEYALPGGTRVHEFRLSDGTRCVMVEYRGGLTCEWRRPVVIVPRVE